MTPQRWGSGVTMAAAGAATSGHVNQSRVADVAGERVCRAAHAAGVALAMGGAKSKPAPARLPPRRPRGKAAEAPPRPAEPTTS